MSAMACDIAVEDAHEGIMWRGPGTSKFHLPERQNLQNVSCLGVLISLPGFNAGLIRLRWKTERINFKPVSPRVVWSFSMPKLSTRLKTTQRSTHPTHQMAKVGVVIPFLST
eukprot:1339865-Amorphochlora_amoeboformis.AAC.2